MAFLQKVRISTSGIQPPHRLDISRAAALTHWIASSEHFQIGCTEGPAPLTAAQTFPKPSTIGAATARPPINSSSFADAYPRVRTVSRCCSNVARDVIVFAVRRGRPCSLGGWATSALQSQPMVNQSEKKEHSVARKELRNHEIRVRHRRDCRDREPPISLSDRQRFLLPDFRPSSNSNPGCIPSSPWREPQYSCRGPCGKPLRRGPR